MSILEPLTSGFVEVVSYNIFTGKLSVLPAAKTKVDKSQQLLELLNVFNSYFPNSSISYESFKSF